MRLFNFVCRIVSGFLSFFKKNKVFLFAHVNSNGIIFRKSNWGDDINLYFLEYISDLHISFYNINSSYKYSCIGSILGGVKWKQLIVWGSGFISCNDKMNIEPYRICSVRGPLTRSLLLSQGISCPESYGDPALLISKYYQPKVKKEFEIGIIPHYSDEECQLLKDIHSVFPEFLIISMKNYKDWRDIPNQICRCKRIVSSSLHGIIVSDSYGIPNCVVRFSDYLKGGDFKFLDYLLSVGRLNTKRRKINSVDDFSSLVISDVYDCADNIDYDKILNACPFKEHLKSFIY